MARIELSGIKEKASTIAGKGKVIAGKGAEKAREGVTTASEKLSDAKYEYDLRTINPISKEQLESMLSL